MNEWVIVVCRAGIFVHMSFLSPSLPFHLFPPLLTCARAASPVDSSCTTTKKRGMSDAMGSSWNTRGGFCVHPKKKNELFDDEALGIAKRGNYIVRIEESGGSFDWIGI